MTDLSEYPPACPKCEEPMVKADFYERYHAFSVGPWEFIAAKWGKEFVCVECPTVNAQERADAIWNEGAQHGYDKAYDEMRADR